ncbi:hypothetical protein GW17_00041075 [Ensete ventricosum]|nr:hypothetical protein GW17_00041075 [Ensete ventricosum]
MVGATTLGRHLTGERAPCPHATPLWVSPLYGLAAGKRYPLRAGCGRVLPLCLVVGEHRPLLDGHERLPLLAALAVAEPLQSASRGRPPPFLAVFIVKTQ